MFPDNLEISIKAEHIEHAKGRRCTCGVPVDPVSLAAEHEIERLIGGSLNGPKFHAHTGVMLLSLHSERGHVEAAYEIPTALRVWLNRYDQGHSVHANNFRLSRL